MPLTQLGVSAWSPFVHGQLWSVHRVLETLFHIDPKIDVPDCFSCSAILCAFFNNAFVRVSFFSVLASCTSFVAPGTFLFAAVLSSAVSVAFLFFVGTVVLLSLFLLWLLLSSSFVCLLSSMLFSLFLKLPSFFLLLCSSLPLLLFSSFSLSFLLSSLVFNGVHPPLRFFPHCT